MFTPVSRVLSFRVKLPEQAEPQSATMICEESNLTESEMAAGLLILASTPTMAPVPLTEAEPPVSTIPFLILPLFVRCPLTVSDET